MSDDAGDPPGEESGGQAPRTGQGRRGPGRRPAKPAPEGRSRIAFEFPKPVMDQLERVRVKSGSSSANEAVRRALIVMERHLDEKALGSNAIYERPDGNRIEMVFV